jgi:PAS domain S-box-containing protein
MTKEEDVKKTIILLLSLSVLYVSGIGTAVSADASSVVRVGVYENQPKIFTDDKGEVSGFWPDIIKRIASEEGWEIQYVHGTWTECLDKLEKNEIDVMPDVAYSDDRAKIYDFGDESVYTSWSLVYTRPGTNIQSIPNLEGKTISVLKGSINEEGPNGIKQLVSSFSISCSFIEVDSYLQVFEMIENKEVDAGVVSKDFAYNHQTEFKVVETAIVFQPALLYFAFTKGASRNPSLIGNIDTQVKQLKANGDSVYYQSLRKWFGTPAIEKPVVPDWLKWLLISFGGLVFVLAGGALILRRQVKLKTKELAEDIEKRKILQEELVRDRADIQLILDTSPALIFYKDRDGKFLRVNKALATSLNIPESVLIGKTVHDIYSAGIARSMEKDDQEVLNSKQAKLNIVEKYESANGLRWVETDKVPVLDKDGEAVALIGLAVDITRRIEAEEARKKSEEKYRNTLDSMMEGCQIIDFNWRFVYLNDNAVKQSRQTRENLLGHTMMEVFPGIEKTELFTNLKRCMEYRMPHRMENLFKYADGSEEWFELSMEPSIDGVFVLSMDISEHKRLEQERIKFTEALEDSLQFNSSVLENSPHPILVRKSDTSITYVNPALEKLTGFTSGELIGKKNIFPFWTEEKLKEQNGDLEKTTSSGIYRQEKYFIKNNKEPFWIETTTTPVKSKGKIKYFISNWTDITERKRTEEALYGMTTRMRELLAAIPDIIMEVNTNKVYTWANQTGIQFFGDDVIGKEAAFYFEGEQDTYDAVKPLFNGNESTFYVESWQIRRDGQKRLLAWWCRVVKDSKGNVTGALSSAQDITERKRTKEALRESERFLDNIMENTPGALRVPIEMEKRASPDSNDFFQPSG